MSKSEDLTGRDRLIWNTLVSWVSQFVVIITGFVLPRLMHETLGQTILGIWDFAWTFINYFNLMSLGIGSSINRFIAKYRAERNTGILNGLVSTVVIIQLAISAAVVLVTLGVLHLLELIYAEKLGEYLEVGQAIVFFLGMSLAIEMLVNSTRGIITGHHRWDIHNGIYAGSSLLTLILMVSVLLLDGNIVDVSIAYLISTLITEGVRVFLAFRIAPDIKFKVNLFSFEQARELVFFGTKTLFLAFPHVILVQSVNLLTVAFLGPAALAVFARPFALIRHLYTLVYKFTMILTPTVGSLQALNNQQEIRSFFKSTLKFNFSISIPAIAFFVFFGDVILVFWMGESYRNWLLVVILSLGHLLAIGQDGIIRIMQGLDKHGRLGLYLFISVSVSVLLSFFLLNSYPWTLSSSALLLTIPMTFSFGIVLPIYSCRIIGVKLSDYVFSALLTPLIYNIPFFLGLLLTRYLFDNHEYSLSFLTLILNGLLEAYVYFKYLLSESAKTKVLKILKRSDRQE